MIDEQVPDLIEQKVRLKFFGHTNDFGNKIIKKIDFAEEKTFVKKSKLDLNVALGYGGKQDIVDITKKISSNVLKNKIKLQDINEKIVQAAALDNDIKKLGIEGYRTLNKSFTIDTMIMKLEEFFLKF